MSDLTSGREGEASGSVRSNVLASDEANHDDQARVSLSTLSEAAPAIDGPSNSGEHIT